MTPTQEAEHTFRRAMQNILALSGSMQPGSALSPTLMNLASGLSSMAIALRAIYIKLEEVETLVKRQSAGRH